MIHHGISQELDLLLERVERDIHRGRNISQPITTAADLNAYLAEV